MDKRLTNIVHQVLTMARALEETAPTRNEDPKEWMRRAKDLADACMVNRSLSSELAPALGIIERGDFLRAIKAIDSAAGAYNSALRPTIDVSLAVIIKILSRELATEGARNFSIHSVRDMARSLTFVQKQVFDAVWNHYLKTEKPLPIRSLLPLLGKQPIREVLKGLNGGLIYETQEDNSRCLTLTLHGVLLTGHGSVLAQLLLGVLDLTKKLFEAESTITGFQSSKIKEAFGDESAQLLLRLLRKNLLAKFPIYVSNVSGDQSTWAVAIRDDEVVKLYQSDDTAAFLDEMLSEAYHEDEPFSYDERIAQSAVNMATAWDSVIHDPFRAAPPPSPPPTAPSYIDKKRLEELRAIKGGKFDCSRLVAMCEELNACAAAGHTHAVIMLTRAIVDHVPPVFGFRSFAQVAANYAGDRERSFKNAMERLDKHTKEVAHRWLHRQISDSEVAPSMGEVSYPGELNHLLSEVYRLVKV